MYGLTAIAIPSRTLILKFIDKETRMRNLDELTPASPADTFDRILVQWLAHQPRSLIDIVAAFGLEQQFVRARLAHLVWERMLTLHRDATGRMFQTNLQSQRPAHLGTDWPANHETAQQRQFHDTGTVASVLAEAISRGALTADDV